MALDSLDVSGGGTYVSLTPFHIDIGEAGSNGGHDIHTHIHTQIVVIVAATMCY